MLSVGPLNVATGEFCFIGNEKCSRSTKSTLDTRLLWWSVHTLMGRGHVLATCAVDPTAFHQYFDAKVADVRAMTADAPPPSFTPAH